MKSVQELINQAKQAIQARKDAKNGYANTPPPAPSQAPEVNATLDFTTIRFEPPVVQAPENTQQTSTQTQKNNQTQTPNYLLYAAIGVGSIAVIGGLIYVLK